MRARSCKAQVAIEYMTIVGIALAFLIPIWVYVTQLQYQTETQLSASYARNTIDNIVYTANLVYSQGPPAKVPLNVYIPKNAELVEMDGRNIHIQLRTLTGLSDMYGSSVADLNGTLPTTEGLYKIYIEARDDYVQITV